MRNYLRISAIGIMTAIAAVVISICGLAYEYTDVKVSNPGDLAAQRETLSAAKPEALRINGKLNSADIIALRHLCGNDRALNPTDGTVKALDLTDVSFLPDGKGIVWFNNMNDSAKITSVNALPPLFLYMTNVEDIKLPSKLDSIYPWSLAMTPLKTLYVADGVLTKDNFIYGDSLLTDIRLPFTTQLYPFSEQNIKSIRNVKSEGFLFATRSAFMDLLEIETLTVNGPVGHIDATPFISNPRLKKITFNGPVYSTGTCLASSCDSLQSVIFNGPVGAFSFDLPEDCHLPQLKSYTFNAPVLTTSIPEIESLDSVEIKNWEGRDEFAHTYVGLIRKFFKAARNSENPRYYLLGSLHFLENHVLLDSAVVRSLLPEYDSLMKEAFSYDVNKSKLQILKESASYAEAFSDTLNWEYVSPSDSLLTAMRVKFNLDSVAGNGDDWSKIKNLTYWIHEMMPHNGSRQDMPATPHRLDNLIEYAQKDSAGGNCRIMAIALNQALLAEGIPSRYITCQSKAYETDGDCHVINVAWSNELGKWVWCDPTFAAFITDANGNPLHPGEVRELLINGGELVLNEDANWNHMVQQTKEDYLERYMAKNLYLISAFNVSRPLTEGPGAITDGLEYITLEPVGFGMRWTDHTTSDAASFWSSPK